MMKHAQWSIKRKQFFIDSCHVRCILGRKQLVMSLSGEIFSNKDICWSKHINGGARLCLVEASNQMTIPCSTQMTSRV